MSDQRVRAERQAVNSLKHAVEAYSHKIRDACVMARGEVAKAARQADEAVQARTSELHKREQDVSRAAAALQQCRENCRGLERELQAALARRDVAQRSLSNARAAVRIIGVTQTELLRSLNAADSKVAEHSSVAASALATLDSKLAQLPHIGAGPALQRALGGVVTTVEVLGVVITMGRIGSDAIKPFNVNLPVADQSVTEMIDHRTEQERDYVVHLDFESRKYKISGTTRRIGP